MRGAAEATGSSQGGAWACASRAPGEQSAPQPRPCGGQEAGPGWEGSQGLCPEDM